MKKNIILILLPIWVILCLISAGSVWADYFDKEISTGDIRVFYPGTTASSCDAILFGVGTSMSADSYDKLSNALIEYGYIVVIMDHNPGNMIKTSSSKYSALASDVKSNLVSWLSSTNCTEIDLWVLGGHSAGGQAAQNAISDDSSLADAIFSVDPYDCSETGDIAIPALYWGFNFTSCFVTKSDAAEAAYYSSNGPRVLQRVKRKYTFGPCGFAPKFFHCSVGDGHCLACTNCITTPDYFFTDMANSVNKFIDAAFNGTWSEDNLEIDDATLPVELFVDTDQP